MNRAIDARLSNLEREIGAESGDQPSYADLLRTIRGVLQGIVARPDTSPAERDAARDKLASLDANVWGRGYGKGQPLLNIIDALEDAKATGRVYCRTVDPEEGDVPTPNWYALARELGLIEARGEADLRSRGTVRLIETVIVSPPLRACHPTEAHGTLQ